jgi:hypothetical protein
MGRGSDWRRLRGEATVMSEVLTPEKGRRQGIERIEKHWSPRSWLAVIVAMVLAAAAGFFAGWNAGPTETRTQTRTVTQTVPASAYATWESPATVFFDGKVCSYVGPGEMAAGTRGRISFRGPVGSVLVLEPMPTAPFEEAVRQMFVFRGGYTYMTSPTDAANARLHPRLTRGVWMVGCKARPQAQATFTATAIRVTPD